MSATTAWEAQYGRPFMYFGQNMLEVLLEAGAAGGEEGDEGAV